MRSSQNQVTVTTINIVVLKHINFHSEWQEPIFGKKNDHSNIQTDRNCPSRAVVWVDDESFGLH